MKVAVLMTNISRYTGGRVHMWTLAYALKKLGHDVTVYTDQAAGFITNNLRGREAPEVEVVGDRGKYPDVKADLYLGMPVVPNEMVARLAEKHGGQALCCLFDTWPALDRAGVKWDEYPREMPYLKSDRVRVLSLAEANNQDIVDWLEVEPDRIEVVYPCINDTAIKEVGDVKSGNSVVFISRLVGHKHLDHLIKAARPLGVRIVVISSDRGESDAVSWHVRVNDKVKFELLKAAWCLCVPSIQEGFGIWATEAWACGIPVVCYDLPTIREIDQGNTYFAEKVGDWKDLQRALILCLEEGKKVDPDTRFYFGEMVRRVKGVVAEVMG